MRRVCLSPVGVSLPWQLTRFTSLSHAATITAHNAQKFVVDNIRQDVCHNENFPQCRDLPNLLLFHYVRLRLHALAASMSKKSSDRQFASKSVAARTVIKQELNRQ